MIPFPYQQAGAGLLGGDVSTAPTDPFFANVVSLLHMDGSNGSTSFPDVKGNTWAATGNAQVTTTSPKFGSGALLTDGTGDWIQSGPVAAYDLISSDFTIEFWVNPTAVSGLRFCFDLFTASTTGLCFYLNGTGFSLDRGSTVILAVAGVFSAGVYQHVAITRSGNSWRVFVDGVQKGSTITAAVALTSSQTLRIANDKGNNFCMNGRIDDFRFTKGVARYTANFTPPAAAFPDA
jgi:hypothetical protein